MPVATTLRTLAFEEALSYVDQGAAFVDLRDVASYLEVHVPGSLELLYEFGPGMASRARDCIPLEVPLVLLDLGHGDLANAAASLRGKGFSVPGKVDDGLNEWARVRGAPASTDVVRGNRRGGKNRDGAAPVILDVGDPGAGEIQGAVHVPIEQLWSRVDEVATADRVVVAAGYGVRAALAIGVLERAGVDDIVFWMP